ncbi:MAG: hypothetical protein DMF59_04050 [Acidobacteria bacterium]|nr:MAG: hypothetical protein DMF59_04050 [Acidobacteriota bacterium]
MSRAFVAILLFVTSPLFAVPGVKSPVKLRTVKPQYWNGRCPHEFRFIGDITSRGAGDVQFTWDRSDGASSPIETIHFTAPNQVRTVRTSWALSQNFRGWEQIRVTAPNFIRSNRAPFQLRCR